MKRTHPSGAEKSRKKPKNEGSSSQTVIEGEKTSGVRMERLQRYKTSDPFCGLMVIINNVNFDKASGREKRDGSDKDVDSLKKTFGQLGFKIRIKKDRTCCEMLTYLTKVARSNLANYDCLAVVILTHGGDGNIICGVGNRVDQCPIAEVLQPLKEIKKEMPKLVFVQACRGTELDTDQCHVQADGGVGFNSRAEKECIGVPIEVDFLYHYSSSPGFSSISNANGSVFIQELCNVYDDCMAEGDEFNVLISHVEINRRVAENFKSYRPNDPAFHGMKQLPSFVTMLRKHLFLKRMA